MQVGECVDGDISAVELIHENPDGLHVEVVVTADVDQLENLLSAIARQRHL